MKKKQLQAELEALRQEVERLKRQIATLPQPWMLPIWYVPPDGWRLPPWNPYRITVSNTTEGVIAISTLPYANFWKDYRPVSTEGVYVTSAPEPPQPRQWDFDFQPIPFEATTNTPYRDTYAASTTT